MLPKFLMGYPMSVSHIKVSRQRHIILNETAVEHAIKNFSQRDIDNYLTDLDEMRQDLVVSLTTLETLSKELVNPRPYDHMTITDTIDLIRQYINYADSIQDQMLDTDDYVYRYVLLCDFYECYMAVCENLGSCWLIQLRQNQK